MVIRLRPAGECELDQVSLGECLLRLSPPGHERIEFAPLLRVWVGGGEYNVAYNLARLGLRSGWVSALPDNPMGRIVLNHARAAGMDVHHVAIKPYDSIGREGRVGQAWIEVGIGPRPSVTVYDRGHSAAAELSSADVAWDELFVRRGVRWFHTGGVYTSLSTATRRCALDAVRAADASGAIVSYDLNYRASLWSIQDAIETTQPLLPHIHCLIGNIGQFQIVLGEPVEGFDLETDRVEAGALERVVQKVTARWPHVRVIATTLREVRSSQVNDFGAVMWCDGAIYHGRRFDSLEIEDRVGGGDGFAAGLIYGLLNHADPQTALDTAVAYGALLHTTPGDNSQVTLAELNRTLGGAGARIVR